MGGLCAEGSSSHMAFPFLILCHVAFLKKNTVPIRLRLLLHFVRTEYPESGTSRSGGCRSVEVQRKILHRRGFHKRRFLCVG